MLNLKAKSRQRQQTPQPGRVVKDQRLGRRDCIYISEKHATSVHVIQSAYCLERAPIPIHQTSYSNGFSTFQKSETEHFFPVKMKLLLCESHVSVHLKAVAPVSSRTTQFS